MLTKGAIGNLVNRYKAVLAKCNLINTFGSLAVASMLVLGGAGVAEAGIPVSTEVEVEGPNKVLYERNTNKYDGGYYKATYDGHLNIHDGVTFSGNSAKAGGAVAFDYNGTGYFNDVIFQDNFCTKGGGAAKIKSSTGKNNNPFGVEFIKVTFSNNRSTGTIIDGGHGGAIYSWNGSKVSIEESKFEKILQLLKVVPFIMDQDLL